MATLETSLDPAGNQVVVECETSGALSKHELGGGNPDTAFRVAMQLAGSVAAQLARQVTASMRLGGAVLDAQFGVKITEHGSVMVAMNPDDCQFRFSIKFSPPRE